MLIIKVLIGIALLVVVAAYDVEDEPHHPWLHIVSHQHECKCELVVDIDAFQQDCPGTRLVACPLNPTRKSQQWRWMGKMLINRKNGLVIDMDVIHGRNLIVAQATNSPTQQFTAYERDRHIYSHRLKFEEPKVMDLHMRNRTLVGTNITTYNLHLGNIPNQLFDIRYVHKPYVV